MKIEVPSLKRRQLIDVDDEVEYLVQHVDEDDDVVNSTIHNSPPPKNASKALVTKNLTTMLSKTSLTIVCRMKTRCETVIMAMYRMALLLRTTVWTAVNMEVRGDQRHKVRFLHPSRLQETKTRHTTTMFSKIHIPTTFPGCRKVDSAPRHQHDGKWHTPRRMHALKFSSQSHPTSSASSVVDVRAVR